jgi:hypothetical protein
METKVKENYFEYNGNKYFRRNAHNLRIASYGKKKDGATSAGYLEVQNRVKDEHLTDKVHYNTTATIDWSQTSKGDVETNGFLKFFGAGGKAAVKTDYEKAKSANLKLMSFAINEGPLKKLLNEDANGARKFMAEEGADARIVSEVWVLVEGKVAEHFNSSGSISASVNAVTKGLEITAKGGKEGTLTIEYEPDVTFAYRMHKVTDWNKGKTEIENMAEDLVG